jgi:hypothetical protein
MQPSNAGGKKKVKASIRDPGGRETTYDHWSTFVLCILSGADLDCRCTINAH